MGIGIHHVDGLVHRLLQQHESATQKGRDVKQAGRRGDVVNISQQARHMNIDQPSSRIEPGLLLIYGPRDV